MGVYGVVFGLFAVFVVGLNVKWASTVETRVCEVVGKESVYTSDGHQYRVYTAQCGVLTVTDDLLSRQFASADLYGQMQEGQSYTVTTRGVRVPFLSAFPNVTDARPVR